MSDRPHSAIESDQIGRKRLLDLGRKLKGIDRQRQRHGSLADSFISHVLVGPEVNSYFRFSDICAASIYHHLIAPLIGRKNY